MIKKPFSKLFLVCLLFSFALNSFAQNITVKGTVTAVGETLPGVSVIVNGTTNGVISDAEGKYSISVPNGNAELAFSFMGYVSQVIAVNNRTVLDVNLKESANVLDEVVVLGYGAEMRKADLSASIGTIQNMEAVKSRPVSGAVDLLQGQIPGVTVLNKGGDPSENPKVVIRGQGSRNGEEPLWVVDGVPGAPVNVNDIESMVVLKDAASAAIYGAYSGSSGVIMVTTKKAKIGVPTVSYEGTFGITTATNLPQSLTIQEEKEVRKKALEVNNNELPNGWDPVKNPYIADTRTDWIDAIFRTALFQRHNVSINAGTENFANRISFQYNNKEGTLVGTYNKSLNMRYDASFKISKHIRIREDFFWENKQDRGADTESGYSGVILSALMMPRNAEARYSDGTFGGTAPKDPAYIAKYGSNYADIHGDVINPVRTLEAATQFKRPSVVNSSTFFEIIEPIPGLKFTSRFTYKLDNYFFKNFSPRRPEPGKQMLTNSLEYVASRYTKWETENTLNYDRTFNKHTIGALLSTTANEQRKREFKANAQGFTDENETNQYFTFGSKMINPSDYYIDPDNNVSVVGRIAYSWNNRYFATASIRRDYAGRLPIGHKYGDFPAVTAAWKISEEPFMPKSDFLNLLKLRASWGRIGNISTVSYAYNYPELQIGRDEGDVGSVDVGGQVGKNTPLLPIMTFPKYAYNPALTWETSETSDFGLDAGLLKNRLNITADYFMKRTLGLIKRQDYGWPGQIGIQPMLINEGEIRNTGFEFTVGWNDQVGEVSYFVNANFATLKNEVYDIGPFKAGTTEKPVWTNGDEFRGSLKPYRTREGDPLYSYWLVQSAGLFQTDEEAAAYVDKDGNRIQKNAKAGDIKFIDQDGDGKINDNDRVYMGAYYPKVTYSLSGGLTFKNLSFSMMFQGVGGSKAFNASKYITLNESQGNFNRWNKILEAGTNDIPRLSSKDDNGNFSTNSDWYLEDASYLRIKNVNLSYSLNKMLYKAFSNLQSRGSALSVSMSIDNLYTFTKYTGIDPEVGGMGMDGLRYPVPRIISFGIKLTY